MAENEAKKVIKTETSKKDVDKKESNSKVLELPPIIKEWTKESVQHALKEWFTFLQESAIPSKKLTKKEVDKANHLHEWDDFLMTYLRNHAIAETACFIDWFIELYTDPFKREAKKFLVSNSMRRLLSDECEHDPNAMYPIIRKINTTIPVHEYPELVFDCEVALYGCILQKTPVSRERHLPLSDTGLISRLKMFIAGKDSEMFTQWVLAIVQYNPVKLSPEFNFEDTRESVKNWIDTKLNNDAESRNLFVDGMIRYNYLQSLLNDLRTQKSKVSLMGALQNETIQLRSQNQLQHEEIEALKKQIEDKNHAIEQYKELQRRMDFEKINWNEKVKQSEQRLNLQILANERLVAENERRLQKATADATQADDRAEQLEEENQKLSQELENVQADLDLAQSNLKNAEQAAGNQESRIQKIFLRNLAEGLAEPLHYLNGTGQFLALTYPEDGAAKDLPEFLSQVNKALSSMGLVSFGQDGEIVAYDPALHELADGMCSKGDSVVILQCGWKIKGDVYKKAIVQKGE